METPTFIESYQTEHYDFCDRVIDRLEELLATKDTHQHVYYGDKSGFMDGAQSNGGAVNRVDFAWNFRATNEPLNIEMHNILSESLVPYGDKYASFRNYMCASQDMKVQKTPPKGGFHTWHSEHSPHDNAPYRVLTWTLYLNDIPDGEGETEFLEYGIKIQPKKGLLSFFPAGWQHTHRGNPVYSCDKYIATGWYYFG